jgi:hemoglobin
VDALFAGEKAAEAKWRGQKMAQMFEMKLEHIHNTGSKHLV